MPNKENRLQAPENKPSGSPLHTPTAKTANVTPKASMSKIVAKDSAMSPGAVPAPSVADDQRPELLGSLTTLQQQRTSARVIKKLKLEPPADKRDVTKSQPLFVDTTECDTPNKLEDKETLKFPTVKQRMPKALWSADEKSLFFEALNEYGKDFDAITTYICAKMKRKGMPDGNLKTKTQVSHFYYRTWHKLAKHVHFDENVKKVAQELYALINYGELRRKLVAVNEKTCARLGEMVRAGSMAVRARGRTVRVRTPMCRALRRLNQITERACGARVCSRATVALRARDAAAWARVQAAAHNPRAALALPPRTALAALLRALHRRWNVRTQTNFKSVSAEDGVDVEPPSEYANDLAEYPDVRHCETKEEDMHDNHLGLEPDRTLQDNHLPKKLALHVGPRPGVEIHLPVLSPSEPLSSQKICFSSYVERMRAKRGNKDESGVKIRTPKRQRKDSATDKDKELEPKKFKFEDTDPKLMNIDETAIDGIELMANYKSNIEDEEKPSTEDEKELKAEETAEEEVEREPERDKDMSEREKDSFSEMEDDEKYNKSDTDNESDWKGDKSMQERKFKNLKVKFRIRPKKRGGSIYTLVLESKMEDSKVDGQKEEETKPDIDVDTAIKQIRKGWSLSDAGDLTIGDLYLMFGSRSRLELDYWWAEPTPPLPQRAPKLAETDKPAERDRAIDRREKAERTPDKGADSSVEDEKEKRESDTDIFSPKNTFSQDSNDGMSGDERKSEQLASPDHKSSGALKLVDKLINRPTPQPPPSGFSQLSDRLKRLLALAGNPHVGAAAAPRCGCGHVCAPKKGHAHHDKKQQPLSGGGAVGAGGERAKVFRPPQPIAPRPRATPLEGGQLAMSLEALPRRRPGRPRLCERRVVVQRLLPLLPKLPPPTNLIPVKIMPKSSPAPPRLLPRPPPTSTSDLSCVYVLSESNGQFYFHDGDRRIPISAYANSMADDLTDQDDLREEEDYDVKDVKMDISATEVAYPSGDLKQDSKTESAPINPKNEQSDITGFLPSESLSLSPSRLLRDAEGWLAGAHDFSLSSFLHTLDARHEAAPDQDRADRPDHAADRPDHAADRSNRPDQPDHTVDSQLQSLMAESSMDYVAKFADLAAEVNDSDPLAE